MKSNRKKRGFPLIDHVGQAMPDNKGRSLRPLWEKVGVARMRGCSLFNLINPSPALRASSPARGEEEATRGFTLIELLVVVLIIGILAAVALPQYQKAVEKSRATQAITLLKTVFESAERYYLEYGTWPTQFKELDTQVPWTGTTPYVGAGYMHDTLSNEDWSIQLYTNYSVDGVIVGKISGPYRGGGFALFHRYDSSTAMKARSYQLFCNEMHNKEGYGENFLDKDPGEYCTKIFGGKRFYGGLFMTYFTLP